ncbi:substrate-binding domain-containing protein [Inquilinus limosus]|uniref:substrate-binding domain-containing protein n=1 Tax=Inquilinus limosus TaxID=171674 RepID=UPI0004170D55|nr:substrate-binding domain-containing protein [Inquilinus limosus]
MKKTLALAVLALAATAGAAQARDQIQVAGSSTVLPFANVVAESFGQAFSGKFKAPIVESGGTGGGLKSFCSGVGENTIDIANASRAINKTEFETCAKNGVKDIIQVKIGYDGIVFASIVNGPTFALTTNQLWKAIAAQVVVDGKVVDNPYKTWKQIDPSLPDQAIQTFIPAENHGTREVFVEKVLTGGCEQEAAVKALGKDEQKAVCTKVRKDGLAVDIAGDYTETLARIQSTQNAVGVFGLSFYEENKDKVKVATVNGVTPTAETIASGEYPVSRPLFFYVKKAHLGAIPGLKEYVTFFLSDQMVGDEGALVEKGLIPMPENELKDQRNAANAGTTLSM